MKSPYLTNAKEKIDMYTAKGYTSDYKVENEKLIDISTGRKYEPEDITIKAEHRYEGMTNPADMSILYVIETEDGSKGTILAPYGGKSATDLAVFMKDVALQHIDEFKAP